MPQVAVKISEISFAKLKRLAHQRMVNYATIIEAALSAYQPETSATSELASLIPHDVISSVLTRLDALETQLAAMQAGTAQNRAVSDAAAQGIPRAHLDGKTAEIGLESPLSGSVGGDSMEEKSEAQFDHSSHPVQPKATAKLTVKEFIAKQIEAGERSPSRIARALNEAGYLTHTRTQFERSNPQITKAIKAVGG